MKTAPCGQLATATTPTATATATATAAAATAAAAAAAAAASSSTAIPLRLRDLPPHTPERRVAEEAGLALVFVTPETLDSTSERGRLLSRQIERSRRVRLFVYDEAHACLKLSQRRGVRHARGWGDGHPPRAPGAGSVGGHAQPQPARSHSTKCVSKTRAL